MSWARLSLKSKTGPFARGVADGSFPVEGIKFFLEQTYQLVMNDMGNLSLYVAKGRDESEVDFFLFMAVAEKLMLDSLTCSSMRLASGVPSFTPPEPHIRTSFRTNYFTGSHFSICP